MSLFVLPRISHVFREKRTLQKTRFVKKKKLSLGSKGPKRSAEGIRAFKLDSASPDLYFLPRRLSNNRLNFPIKAEQENVKFFFFQFLQEYLKNMEEIRDISYFELNLETWRQLWRVLEMSDVLLVIVDIRFPALMFPPYLYNYVTRELRKEMILILNKIDLAPAPLVLAWREYFKSRYPELKILYFTSFPAYNLRRNTACGENLKTRRRKGKLKMAAEGAQKLMETCRDIVGDQVDLTSWQEKIQEEMHLEYDLDDLERKDNVVIQKEDTSFFKHERFKNGVLTIGCIGTPNVGKSSLMNALMG